MENAIEINMSLEVDDAQFNGAEALAWRILQDQERKIYPTTQSWTH